MIVLMGVEVGNRQDPKAICIAEQEVRANGDKREDHFVVRTLKRLDPGMSYPKFAEEVGRLASRVEEKTGSRVELFVNATGKGEPIRELLDDVPNIFRIWTVYFNHGDRRVEDKQSSLYSITLGKAYLVSRLKVLIECGQLHIPRTPHSELLAKELQEYQVKVSEDANERYGAFRVGSQDELVMALGLAVQKAQRRSIYPSGPSRPEFPSESGLSAMVERSRIW